MFWPALFIKGKEAEFKAGTVLQAYISESTQIKINPDYIPVKSYTQNPVIEVVKDCGSNLRILIDLTLHLTIKTQQNIKNIK